MPARIIPWPSISMTADLREALDAVDVLSEALIQAIGNKKPTPLQIDAMNLANALRQKHDRLRKTKRDE